MQQHTALHAHISSGDVSTDYSLADTESDESTRSDSDAKRKPGSTDHPDTGGDPPNKRSLFRKWSAQQRTRKRKQPGSGTNSPAADDTTDGDDMALATRKNILESLPSTLRKIVKKGGKKEGNRVAAKKCREKKKMYITQLQDKAAVLEEDNLRLLQQLCRAHHIEVPTGADVATATPTG